MVDTYLTISGKGKSDFRDRGSKFLGYAFGCESEAGFKAELEQIKKNEPAARHFCSASIIGFPNSEHRQNDDGEPSGSAGAPILYQILSHNLTNVSVVVVRYFGGTKLGKSGLIHAYKEAALMALTNARTATKTISMQMRVIYPYESTGEVLRLVEKIPKNQIVNHVFDQLASTYFTVPKSRLDDVLHLFNHLKNVEVETVVD